MSNKKIKKPKPMKRPDVTPSNPEKLTRVDPPIVSPPQPKPQK